MSNSKKIMAAFLFAAMLIMLFGCKKKAEEAKEGEGTETEAEKELPPPTEKEVGYAYGMILAYAVKENHLSLNPKSVLNGLKAGLKAESIQIAEYESILQRAFTKARKDFAAKNLEEQNAFLEKNKAKEGVLVTESGLQYEVIAEGDGVKPVKEDTLKIEYTGTFLDGKEFDSSEKSGGPVEIAISNVIKGWQEALLLMSKGAHYKVYVPAELGYGEQGFGFQGQQIIPPNALLIFDIKLVDFVKKEPETKK